MTRKTFRFVNEDTVFTLPWEVGILEGLFDKIGIDVQGAEKNPSNTAPELFGRNKEVLFEGQKLDAYNVCEWGAIKRTAVTYHRPPRILNLREFFTTMGTVIAKDSGIAHPEEMAGGDLVSMAYYNGMVVVGEKYDSETMEKIQGVLREAVDLINQDKRKYAHLLLNDLPEDLRPRMTLDDLHVDRLRYVYPRAYSQERYEKQAEWVVEWGLLDEGVKPKTVLSAIC